MPSVLIPSIGVVLVALIGLVGQLATSRNERSITNQEVDLLQKLDPKSKAAKDLSEVIEARVNGWHRRFYKPIGQPQVPGQRRRRRSAEDANFWFSIAIAVGVGTIVVVWAILTAQWI